MTPLELIENAHSVESSGIPVNWKEVSIKVYQSTASRITELEEKVKSLEKWIEGLPEEPKKPD